jgi:hypothetical protein
MALYSTPFENTVRIVSGNAAALPDDVVILCNTTAGAVTLILQDIPINRWNVLWKLFVIDYSNNASVNNITINAPSGQTINLGSSIVINSNGGGYVFEISGNGSYLGTPTSGGGGGGGGVTSVGVTAPITNSGSSTAPVIGITEANGSTSGYLSALNFNAFSSKGSPLAIINSANTTVTTAATSIKFDTNLNTSNVGGAVTVSANGAAVDVQKNSVDIVTSVTKINFDSDFDVTASVTPNKVNVGLALGSWQNCEGFEHQATITTVQRPQCRVVGGILYFRGTAIVPLATTALGTTYVPPSSTTLAYYDDAYAFVFQGTSGLVKGCLLTNNLIEFNLGASIIPPSITFAASGKFNSGWKLYHRGIASIPPKGTLLTTLLKAEMEQGILRIYPYAYEEITLTGQFGVVGTGRLMTAAVENGAKNIDFTTSVPNGVGPAPSYTHSSNDTSNFYMKYAFTSIPSFTYDVISAENTYLGGFHIELDGLMAFP